MISDGLTSRRVPDGRDCGGREVVWRVENRCARNPADRNGGVGWVEEMAGPAM
jgi:hypothetical protein